MYEHFFGLAERPFDLTPNPRFLVLTRCIGEALSNLEYAMSSRKGITLLIGEAGSGKDDDDPHRDGKQPERVHCVHLHNPALTRDEFVEMLAARFGLSADAQGVEDGLSARSSRRCCADAARRRDHGADRRRGAEPCRSNCSRRFGCWRTSRPMRRSCCR